MELAELFADAAADITADVAADVAVDVVNRTELKARVEIWQPKEFKVFDALRLSIEVFAEVLMEIFTEILTEILKVKASLVVYYLGSSIS